VKVDSRLDLSSDISFATTSEDASSLVGTLSRALLGDESASQRAATNGDSCPAGIHITFKLVNNASDCEDNTLYYQARWLTGGGEENSGQITVAAGGESTLSITAGDSDEGGEADFVAFDYSVFDPDPAMGCASGEGSQEDILVDGDTWTITIHADGSFSEEVTHEDARAKATTPAERKRDPLQPIPDPQFSER
jgi:hypothetical protein